MEIQWFTLRLYKNNHNILNMDLYSLIPREIPRLKSYGAFLWNSKSDFPIQKADVSFFLGSITSRCSRNEPALDRDSERKSSHLSFGHLRIDATFRYLNWFSSNSISTLAMIFVDLFFLGWSEGARKTYCWWRRWKRRIIVRSQFGWWSRWNHTNNITCWSPASQCFISKTR